MLKHLCPEKRLTVSEKISDILVCAEIDTVVACDLIGKICSNVDESLIIGCNEHGEIIRILLSKHFARSHSHHKAESNLRGCTEGIVESGDAVSVIHLCRLNVLKEFFVYPFIVVNEIIDGLELKICNDVLVEEHSTDSAVVYSSYRTGREILSVADRPSLVRGLCPPLCAEINVLDLCHIKQISGLCGICGISKSHIQNLIRSISRGNTVGNIVTECNVSAFLLFKFNTVFFGNGAISSVDRVVKYSTVDIIYKQVALPSTVVKTAVKGKGLAAEIADTEDVFGIHGSSLFNNRLCRITCGYADRLGRDGGIIGCLGACNRGNKHYRKQECGNKTNKCFFHFINLLYTQYDQSSFLKLLMVFFIIFSAACAFFLRILEIGVPAEIAF